MGFAFACLKKLTLVFSMPGCMFGIFLDCNFLKTGTHSFFSGTGSLLQVALRPLVMLVNLPFLLPLAVLSSKNPDWFVLVFKYAAPMFMSGFSMFAFTRWIFIRVGLGDNTLEIKDSNSQEKKKKKK